MRTNFSWGVLSLSFFVAACGGANSGGTGTPVAAKPAASAPAAPANSAGEVTADTLFVRESTGLKAVSAKSGDGNLAVSVESSAQPTFEAKNNVPQVTIPIGAEQPVICLLRGDAPSTGSLLRSLISGVQKEEPKNQITMLDAAVLGNVPYYLAELQYIDEKTGKPLLGALKIAVFGRAGDTLLCMHDELGYRATFKRVAESVAKTLQKKNAEEPTAPNELEILLAKVQQQPMGYTLERHFITPEGTHVEIESSTMLVRRSATELMSMESVRVTESSKDGIATKIRTLSEEGGEQSESLTVERKSGGKYHVEGTKSGKAVKGDFTSKNPIWASWRQRAEVRDKMLRGRKVRELSLSGYSSGANPTGMTPTTYKATSDANAFDITHGEMQLRATLDADARTTQMGLKMGAIEIAFERAVLESHK
ncbi:hypothetical protein LZC95_02630 [Pendulispora brunnea]|uniref:Uncharacterized protein n=1 Tax=Pendulispora brunnea TaxID=2905690 RepID=A0ABZ2KF71_9BACT